MVITEVISTGQSVERIKEALQENGVRRVDHRCASGSLYLSGSGSANEDRVVVGIDKKAPDPISRRHPSFEGVRSAQLRHFLSDYAGVLYLAVFDEHPPLPANQG